MAEITIPDPACVLLVGPAGAGKSTFAARHFPPDAILSTDALREAIAGDAADQSASGAAFRALHRAIDRRLGGRRLVVVDATNLAAVARRTIRGIAARHGVPVVAIVLDLPEPLVRRQNAIRPGRRVPDEVVTNHLDALTTTLDSRALESEGYARIVHLRDPVEVARLVVRLEPTDSGQ